MAVQTVPPSGERYRHGPDANVEHQQTNDNRVHLRGEPQAEYRLVSRFEEGANHTRVRHKHRKRSPVHL